MKPKSIKIYKSLQKEPKMFGMNRVIALQFLGACTFTTIGLMVVFGATIYSFSSCIVLCFGLFFAFKKRNSLNDESNFKKRNQNKRKPLSIKSKNSIIIPIPSNESIFN